MFERAREVADAVLYEGYALYPYRASSAKNRVRWQFGVLAPREWSLAGGCEQWSNQTECLVEAGSEFELAGKLRFLHVVRRRVEERVGEPLRFREASSLEVDGKPWIPWEEGAAREVDFSATLGVAHHAPAGVAFAIPSERTMEPIRSAKGATVGRSVREASPLAGIVRVSAEAVGEGLFQLRIVVENVTDWHVDDAPRAAVLGACLLGTHSLLAVRGGTFVSMVDPAAKAKEAARRCKNKGTWPVLVGAVEARDEMLSAPIILYDYPEVAPESPGELFDSLEIDEILTLRTLTLTDLEKAEARAPAARAGAIIDRAEAMSSDTLERLHGTWRSSGLRGDGQPRGGGKVTIQGVEVKKGSRVRILPAARRADAQDMFNEDRAAVVQDVLCDAEGNHHVAVTMEGDPAAELYQWKGRYLYYAPDEVFPIGDER